MTDARDDHEGPRHDAGGINFHLSRKEPSHLLMWSAGVIGFMLLGAWFGGKLDGVYMLTYVGVFVFLYVVSWMDETNAEEDRSIKLRVSPEGIDIPEKFRGTIGWADIESVVTSSHKGTTTLHVVPTASASARLPVNEGWLKWLAGKGINYQITHLEGDDDDVVAAIRRFGPSHLTQTL